ncbi:MAG: hypothetical protein R3E96_07490 [Planctomycetota bacterium]
MLIDEGASRPYQVRGFQAVDASSSALAALVWVTLSSSRIEVETCLMPVARSDRSRRDLAQRC